jgi:hypothetical protein
MRFPLFGDEKEHRLTLKGFKVYTLSVHMFSTRDESAMKTSFVDLRTKSSEILQALDRNEPVTIQYRGRTKAIMQPVDEQIGFPLKARQHAAFGMWQDRAETDDVAVEVRELRRGRFDAR